MKSAIDINGPQRITLGISFDSITVFIRVDILLQLLTVKKVLAVLTNVACAYVQPAPDNGVDCHGAGG